MTEWRFFRGWSTEELRERLGRVVAVSRNHHGSEAEMTGEAGWHHYYSEAVIARELEGDVRFQRGRVAVDLCAMRRLVEQQQSTQRDRLCARQM